MGKFVSDHPEFMWLVSTALFGWALRWLRRLIKDEAASIKSDVLTAIETRKYVTSDTVERSLTELREELASFVVRFDQHLERCIQPPPRR